MSHRDLPLRLLLLEKLALVIAGEEEYLLQPGVTGSKLWSRGEDMLPTTSLFQIAHFSHGSHITGAQRLFFEMIKLTFKNVFCCCIL